VTDSYSFAAANLDMACLTDIVVITERTTNDACSELDDRKSR
jgi:hypothetical protein